MIKTKFRPILFSTPMVQAILEGRKTQTRRTKGLKDSYPKNVIFERCDSYPKQGNWIAKCKISSNPNLFEVVHIIKCPYNVGDVLWVRETFGLILSLDEIVYKADICSPEIDKPFLGWKPPIFMPKSACRIFLKIKSIRVERLQDISEEDAIAEGIKVASISKREKAEYQRYDLEPGFGTNNAIYSFETLYKKINGKDSWNKNPFVWVHEFERIDKPLDFIV